MMGGSSQGNPTHSINYSKREPYHKQASNPREEEKEECAPEAWKGYHHSPSSYDSLSPRRKKQRSNDNYHGEFRKIKDTTYEGEVNSGEKVEDGCWACANIFRFINTQVR